MKNMLLTNKSDVFCAILLFSRSQFCGAATFLWIWTVWLKLPLSLWQRREWRAWIGFCCSRGYVCQTSRKFGSILPREKSGPASFCIFPYRQILTGEKLWLVIQLLHSLTLLTSCMIQRAPMSNFGANNLRNWSNKVQNKFILHNFGTERGGCRHSP